MNLKFYYQCVDCGDTYHDQEVTYLCPKCSLQNSEDQPPKGVLKVLYNYENIKDTHSQLAKTLISEGFFSLMPLNEKDSLPFLRIGKTPIYNVSSEFGLKNGNVFIKDDSLNPTYSFKDRASAIVSAYAKENNIDTIVTASTGNAGSSIAGICASQQQKAIVMVPSNAPKAKLVQILMYGAQLVPVDGTYDDAFDLSIKASEEFGWFNRNTAFNPLTIEGKKTVSFEIYQEFGDNLPEFIFVPVGDGVIISGVYKGFEDLLKLGLIKKIPTIISVQTKGSNNLNKNLNTNKFTYTSSNTIADSISVDIPRNFLMAKQFLKKYNGIAVEVSDQDILKASVFLSKKTGLFAEPAAVASVAGFLKFSEENSHVNDSNSLILLTGSGLKDLNAVSTSINMPEAISCDLMSLKKLLHL